MIKFLLGESRELEFEITHINNEDFIIREATYELYKENEIVEQGDMLIDDHIISVVFTPEERGFYLLKFMYSVADTTRGAQYHINVD